MTPKASVPASTPASTLASTPASTLADLGAGAVVIALIFALQFALTDSSRSLGRPLWTDELISFSQTLAIGEGLSEGLRTLARSPDLTPPGYHLLLAGWVSLIGEEPTATALRLSSLLWVFLGLVASYGLLRRSFATLPAATGVAAIWASSEVVGYAFELRGYAAWFGLQACFCLLLALANDARHRRVAQILLAPCAALLCTVHYFGVLTLALSLAGWALVELRRGRRAPLAAWPASLGLLALAACLPTMFQQIAVLSEPTWLGVRSLRQELAFISFFIAQPVLVVIAAFALAWALGRESSQEGEGTRWAQRPSGLAAMLAIALLPVVLVLFGRLHEPVAIARYAFPATLAGGPVVALLVGRMPRMLAGVCLVLTLGVSTVELDYKARTSGSLASQQQVTLALLQRHTGEDVIAFEQFHDIAPLLWLDRSLTDRLFYLDVDEASNRHERYLTGFVLAGLDSWGWPRRLGAEDLRGLDRLFLVSAGRLPGAAFIRTGQFEIEQVGGQLWRLRRSAPISSR
ncbi:MAG: hypothetical protein JRH19_24405 [Deltaproteobacteria bacterium]|nr:hypothetical protein [Deltaproteobacteria bacterium]